MKRTTRTTGRVITCALISLAMMTLGLTTPAFAAGRELVASATTQAQAQAAGTVAPASVTADVTLADTKEEAIARFSSEMLEAIEKWDRKSRQITFTSTYKGAGFNELTHSDYMLATRHLLDKHPEYFYVGKDDNGSYTIHPATSGGKIVDVSVYMDTKDIDERIATFDRTVAGILAKVDPAWSAEEKALYLHDYIAAHCEYDTRVDSSDKVEKALVERTAYSCLVDGLTVCQGYGLAYEYLCNKAGVPCDFVTSASMNHGWNIVKIGDHWYHVDCTWDDNPANYTLPQACGHENMLRSNEGIKSTRHTGDLSTTGTIDWVDTDGNRVYDNALCNDTTYDSYYWSESRTATQQAGRLCVYAGKYQSNAGQTEIRVHDYSANAARADRLFCYADGVWSDKQYSYLSGGYTSLAVWGNTLYVAEPSKIYAYDLTSFDYYTDNEAREMVKELDESEKAKGNIYGIRINDDGTKLVYDLRTSCKGGLVDTGEVALASFVAVTSVTVEPATLTLEQGKISTLTATVEPADATDKDITWASSDDNVATVDYTGTVTAVNAGTATIRATNGESGVTGTCSVTVQAHGEEPSTPTAPAEEPKDISTTSDVNETAETPTLPAATTAGTGATAAKYEPAGPGVVTYTACASTKKAKNVTVPAYVTIAGFRYEVAGIKAGAFKGMKKLKTIEIKSTKLNKKNMRNCLKGSKVKTVKVPKSKRAAYKKLFTKEIAGRNVQVK